MSKGQEILIVDDEAVVVHAASKILGAEGFEVDVACDGETCLKKVEAQAYDLVLCDLMVPRVQGFELVDEVRERLPGVPVVLISGYATVENALGGFRRGVFDFIPKPFDVGELVGVVRRGLDYAAAASTGSQPFNLAGWLRRARTVDGRPAQAYTLGRHAWAIIDADARARIGMGETFAALSGELREVELPAPGDELLQGNRCVRVVTADQLVHRLWAPLSGKVVEANDRAIGDVNTSDPGAICKTWWITMIPGDPGPELPQLTRLWGDSSSPAGSAADRSKRTGPWSS